MRRAGTGSAFSGRGPAGWAGRQIPGTGRVQCRAGAVGKPAPCSAQPGAEGRTGPQVGKWFWPKVCWPWLNTSAGCVRGRPCQRRGSCLSGAQPPKKEASAGSSRAACAVQRSRLSGVQNREAPTPLSVESPAGGGAWLRVGCSVGDAPAERVWGGALPGEFPENKAPMGKGGFDSVCRVCVGAPDGLHVQGKRPLAD